MATPTYRVEIKAGRKWVPAPFCHFLPLERAQEAVFDFVNRDIALSEKNVPMVEYRIVNNDNGEVLIQR